MAISVPMWPWMKVGKAQALKNQVAKPLPHVGRAIHHPQPQVVHLHAMVAAPGHLEAVAGHLEANPAGVSPSL